MSIKFREVNEKDYIVILDNGVMIKPYFTITELNTIINDMNKQDSSIGRHFGKVVLTIEFATNIDVEKYTNDELYNLASKFGLINEFYTTVQMFDKLDDIFKGDRDIYDLVKGVTDSLEKSISGANSPEQLEAQMNQMKELVVNNANKESNAVTN